MRPQQQNRRMRGRNNNNNNSNNSGGGNNNRKGGNQNPLARSYESNGPDVKIRGNAQQIADKYAQLARDAQSSGDRVMAENYLQHAEHYNRIIAAYQAQLPQNTQQSRDEFDDEDGEEGDFERQGNGQENGQQPNGSGPQPVIEGTPAEIALNSEAAGNGQNGGQREPRGDRNNREDRFRNNRRDRNRDRNNGDYQRRDAQGSEGGDESEGDSLPAFVTNGTPAFAPAEGGEAPVEAAAPAEAPKRTRRPRRGENAPEAAPSGEAEVVSTVASDQPPSPAFAEE